jgi:hypothetical protein
MHAINLRLFGMCCRTVVSASSAGNVAKKKANDKASLHVQQSVN